MDSVLKPFANRPSYGRLLFVTVMFKSMDEIMWCYHSNKTSFAETWNSATVQSPF